MKILVLGLSGSGKTTLAKQLYQQLPSLWLNADKIRSLYNDWDFSLGGRLRQAKRMTSLADVSEDRYVIIDMVAPLEEMRTIINPNLIVWMNTVQSSRYSDTDSIFEPPVNADIIITDFDYNITEILAKIEKYLAV
jgi:adenylylsulfate kinase-like enzyme